MLGNLLLVLVASVVFVLASDEDLWNKFKSENNKSYESAEEESRRFQIFQDNLKLIQDHNQKYDAGEVTYKLAVNKFSDLTKEEFKEMHTGKIVHHQ